MVEKITEKLIASGYKPNHAADLAERLCKSEYIREPLNSWVENGTETDCSCEGFSALELMKTKKFTYPAALIAIAWLKSDPVTAKTALTSGVDSVGGGM